LNRVLRQRAEEIDNWKSRYSKIEISITEYKGLEGRLREYENRIALLSQEIERLNGVLKARADEIEQWRVNYSKLEITINEYKVIESRGKDMESRVSMLLREIHDWKSRYSKLEISIGEYRNLEGRLKENENR
jgi:DNA repair exonuclease SbcCD ATPase subunit